MEILYPHNTSAATARQLQIENCLQRKMLALPLSQISVSDICREIGISRRTFYTYFPDKEACFEAVIDRIIRASMLLPTSGLGDKDPMQLLSAYLGFWKGHRDILDIIAKQDMIPLFRERSLHLYLEEDDRLYDLLDTEDVKADRMVVYLFIVLLVEFLLQWQAEGFRTETEEMARKYIRLTREPLIRMKSDLAP